MKDLLKRALLLLVSRITGREAVLLPRDAAAGADALSVRAPYRADGGVLTFELVDEVSGRLSISVRTDEGILGPAVSLPWVGADRLALRLADGMWLQHGAERGSASGGKPVMARRFTVDFVLHATPLRRRTTSHYLPRAGDAVVGEEYYSGDDYQDYEAESRDVQLEVAGLVERHARAGASVLDIGCATGDVLAALKARGHSATGIDFSAWAVDEANRRLGGGVFRCDLSSDDVPDAVRQRGPFDVIVMSGVLEHFGDPAAILAKLTPLAANDACLIVLTTNADSLSHRVFARDWEGPFDWTHHGVDMVAVPWLRTTLEALGWSVAEMQTRHFWHGGEDPVYATFRDWLDRDARFRLLLKERDLGDFVRCVAIRGRRS